jgi:hypothetical protein
MGRGLLRACFGRRLTVPGGGERQTVALFFGPDANDISLANQDTPMNKHILPILTTLLLSAAVHAGPGQSLQQHMQSLATKEERIAFLKSPSKTSPPPGAAEHVAALWHDKDGNGWNDVWEWIFPELQSRDVNYDADGDGMTCYEEMLQGMTPLHKILPRMKPVKEWTAKERQDAEWAAALAREREQQRMAARRVELRKRAGREIGIEGPTGRGLSLAEMDANRFQKFRSRVVAERPLKEARMEQARKYLRDRGMPEVIKGGDGTVIRFANERDGKPVYYGTQNTGAAETISVDEINAATPAGLGLNLTGAGVNVGHFDTGNALFAHPEFAPLTTGGYMRIFDMENVWGAINLDGSIEERRHSTHTGGTIIGKGLSGYENAKGAARGSVLLSCDYRGDIGKMEFVHTNNTPNDDFPVSNHSYGVPVGWESSGTSVSWVGYKSQDGLYSTDLATYTQESCDLDQFVEAALYTLPVFAAGNDRDDNAATTGSVYMANQAVTCTYSAQNGWTPYAPPTVGDGQEDGGYFTLRPQACARNVLTVGSCAKIPGGYAGPGSVQVSSYSGWGPTRGQMIKPDVVAAGESVYSAWINGSGGSDYSNSSGTSMAAPNVTASIALLVEQYKNHYGANAKLWSSTLKGLIVHTADDADSDGDAATHPDGPDYRVGYGLVNARKAAEVISADGAHGHHPFIKQVLATASYDSPRDFFEIPIVSAGGPMRITVCFNDVHGEPAPPDDGDEEEEEEICYGEIQMSCDAFLKHPAPSTDIAYPWTLGWAAPEDPADNAFPSTENVQVIDLPATTAGQTYILCLGPYVSNLDALEIDPVWGDGTLGLSVIISGAQAPVVPEFKITDTERVSSSPHVFSLEWPTTIGEFYRVETSTDLINWTRAKKPVGAGVDIGDICPENLSTTVEVLAEPSNTRQFWRVKKLQPWDIAP